MVGLQPRNFSREKRVTRKLNAQSGKQFEGAGLVLFAHIGDRQQDAGKRRQIVPALRRQLQVGDATFLVARQSPHPHQPAYRRRQASNNVFAESRRQLRIVTIRTHRQQLLRPRRRLFGVVQRRQISLLNQRRIVVLQSRRQG